MLTNQVIQKTIQDIKRVSGYEISLWGADGESMASSASESETLKDKVKSFIEDSEMEDISERADEETALFAIYADRVLEYVMALTGTGDDRMLAGRMGVIQVVGLMKACGEQMDKDRFIQNLLLDNLLVVDIYNRARKLHIANERRRVVFIVEPKDENDNLVLETMRGLYGMGTRDFVTAVDEGHIILVKELESKEDYPEILQMAKVIVDTLSMEAMVNVRVSYGTIVQELKEVSRSYKEADMALEVGRVFYGERGVLAYNELGIGRLVHQLPRSLCEMFLKEVLAVNATEMFDDEELVTVYAFFDNNLNISETARKLFIHRNTLVYRLEKIQRKTGLDVRVFEDALTFKIAVMVEKHLKYLNNQ